MESPQSPREPPDARGARFENGIVALAILGGFVFRVSGVLPALTAILAISAVAGPRLSLFLRIYKTLLAPRMGAPMQIDDGDEARIADLMRVGMLALATVALLIGLGGVAWIIALVQAFASALRAAGFHVATGVVERLQRRG